MATSNTLTAAQTATIQTAVDTFNSAVKAADLKVDPKKVQAFHDQITDYVTKHPNWEAVSRATELFDKLTPEPRVSGNDDMTPGWAKQVITDNFRKTLSHNIAINPTIRAHAAEQATGEARYFAHVRDESNTRNDIVTAAIHDVNTHFAIDPAKAVNTITRKGEDPKPVKLDRDGIEAVVVGHAVSTLLHADTSFLGFGNKADPDKRLARAQEQVTKELKGFAASDPTQADIDSVMHAAQNVAHNYDAAVKLPAKGK